MSFHTVVINSKFKPVKTTFNSVQSDTSVEEHWLNLAKEYFVDLEYSPKNINRPLYTSVNGPYTDKSSNAVLESFLWAYYRHHDIVLSPDDMWLLVCMYFAAHVNNNPEQRRSIFVEHEGKILLKVSGSEDEYNWDEVFHKMKTKIMKNTKNDVSQLLSADFSTTERVELILSTTCIMRVFKPYVDYHNTMYTCGIRRVHFTGTLHDWLCLREKTEQLKSFSKGRFHQYVDGILPIFDQFIETYKGNVSRRFWNKICKIKRDKLRRLRRDQTADGIQGQNLTGWLAQLFGRPNMLVGNISEFRLPCIHAPMEMIKSSIGKKIQCRIIGGFHGINASENLYKPVMSFTVIEETILPMSEEACQSDDDDDDEDQQNTHL